MRKLYIIEDDPVIRSELVKVFELLEDTSINCFEEDDFAEAHIAGINANADIYIVDLNLPNNDGISISKEIKKQLPSAKIVILTSSDSDIDEIRGMQIGVDDYITKPFNVHVLIAHIEKILRDIDSVSTQKVTTYKGIIVDFGKSSVSFNDKSADLTKNELRILKCLIDADGSIVGRSDLMFELWQSDRFVDDNTLTVNINRLRGTLKSVGVENLLVTHRGQGYSL